MDSIGSLLVLRVLRLFRVLRIFKLSRHSKNMIAFGLALHASLAELLMLGLFLLIDVIIFARYGTYNNIRCHGNQKGIPRRHGNQSPEHLYQYGTQTILDL